MRCINCGYDNGAGYTACIKCGQPLQAFEQPSYNPTPQRDMLRGTVVSQSAERHAPRPTVVGVYPNHQQERETMVFPTGGEQKTQLISPTPCHQCVVMENGKLIYEFPSVSEISAYRRESLATFWEEYKRLKNPHIHKVDLSDELYKLKQKLLNDANVK